MKKVTLQFDDMQALLEFLNTIKVRVCQYNLKNLTALCEISEAEMELATNGFNAHLLEMAD